MHSKAISVWDGRMDPTKLVLFAVLITIEYDLSGFDYVDLKTLVSVYC